MVEASPDDPWSRALSCLKSSFTTGGIHRGVRPLTVTVGRVSDGQTSLTEAGTGVRRAARRCTLFVAVGAMAASVIVVAPDLVSPVEAAAEEFVVDSVGDESDLVAGDGTCATALATCTFRAAIEESEANPGRDRITFAIPGVGPHTIQINTLLPRIEDDPAGLVIDGYSQTGAIENTLDHGSNAVLQIEFQGLGPADTDGLGPFKPIDFLDVRSGGNEIRGIAIFDFRRHLRFWGPSSTNNEVTGNFIGTNAAATHAATSNASSANGVHIEEGASSNHIGLPGNEHRNVISGNADKGVAVFDRASFHSGTGLNWIRNNLIGLAPDGVTNLGNVRHGVDINYNSSDNQVGGFTAAERNVISGNGLSGVEISHNDDPPAGRETERNLVVGNWIGTTADGTAGTLATANSEHGVNLEGDEKCDGSCPPDIARNTVDGNVIVGSLQANVMIWKGAHENVVRNNRIGLLADGSRPASWANTQWGVLIQAGAFDNVIDGNVIAGLRQGVHIKPDNDFPADGVDGSVPFDTYGNTITRNSIFDIEDTLGIDLYREVSPGVFVSGPTDPPAALVNGGISKPAIVSATTDQVVVDACVGCIIEIFDTPDLGPTFAWKEFGRGKTFVVDAEATTATHTIVLRTSQADPLVLLEGRFISATVTDLDGNTSEFSVRLKVIAGLVPDPPSTTTTTTTTTTTLPQPTTTTSTTTTSTTTTTTATTTTVPRAVGLGGSASATDRAVRCNRSATC